MRTLQECGFDKSAISDGSVTKYQRNQCTAVIFHSLPRLNKNSFTQQPNPAFKSMKHHCRKKIHIFSQFIFCLRQQARPF